MGHEGTLSSSVVMLTTMFECIYSYGMAIYFKTFYVNLANLDPM